MAIFPDVRPDWGYSMNPVYRTDKLGPTDGDFVQRRRRRSTPLYEITLSYSGRLDASKVKQLLDFFKDHYGGWGAFTFYDFLPVPFSEFQVGIGDGTTTRFLLENYRDIQNELVLVDGFADPNYVIERRTGPDGQDELFFPTAPASGVTITIEGEGCLRVDNCIFEKDVLPTSLESWLRYGIKTFRILQVSK
jgi:hypothetical protein